MAVTDRWHKTYPTLDDRPCGCGTAKRPLHPTAEHPRPAKDGTRAFSGGKRWQVRYRDDSGEQRSKNFQLKEGDDPEQHATAFDAKVNSDLNTDNYLDPKAGQVTLEKYLREWRAAQSSKISTLSRLDNFLDKWVYGTSIARVPMARLAKRPTLIQAWIKTLNQELEPSTVRWGHGRLSSVFVSAVDDGVAARNPCRAKSVKLPTVVKKKIVPLTLDQYEAIHDDLAAEYQAIATLGAGCGLRQGELFGIAKEDIDFLKRTVTIRRQVKLVKKQLVFGLPKGDKVRVVPLPDSVGLDLAAHMQQFPPTPITLAWEDPDGSKTDSAALLFVWTGPQTPGAINRNTFNHRWYSAREAAGLSHERKNGMHLLRHTFASACLSEGVDIKTLAEWLGHEDPGFTLRTYAHLMPNAADKGRAAVDAFFAGKIESGSALSVPSGRVGSS